METEKWPVVGCVLEVQISRQRLADQLEVVAKGFRPGLKPTWLTLILGFVLELGCLLDG